MAFFRKRKKRKSQPQELVPARQTQRRTRKVVPVEVKLLAAEDFAAGFSAKFRSV